MESDRPGSAEELFLRLNLPDDAHQFHRIVGMKRVREFSFVQTELNLAVMTLGDHHFAAGEGRVLGHPAVWVAAPGPIGPAPRS